MVTESRYRRYFVPDRMMPGFVLSFIRVSHKRIQKIKVNVVNIRITFQESVQVHDNETSMERRSCPFVFSLNFSTRYFLF